MATMALSFKIETCDFKYDVNHLGCQPLLQKFNKINAKMTDNMTADERSRRLKF